MPDTDTIDLLHLTAEIVSAHVGRTQVPADGLPALIHAVHAALAGASEPVPAEPARPEPAVPIRRSVFPDHIVCLEDGKKLKMLKRYLDRVHGMTPVQYRERWGLPPDYPMVAPNYGARRSELARTMGLGRKGGSKQTEPSEPAVQRVAEGRSGTRKARRKAATATGDA